jgi:hypothetical protein
MSTLNLQSIRAWCVAEGIPPQLFMSPTKHLLGQIVVRLSSDPSTRCTCWVPCLLLTSARRTPLKHRHSPSAGRYQSHTECPRMWKYHHDVSVSSKSKLQPLFITLESSIKKRKMLVAKDAWYNPVHLSITASLTSTDTPLKASLVRFPCLGCRQSPAASSCSISPCRWAS